MQREEGRERGREREAEREKGRATERARVREAERAVAAQVVPSNGDSQKVGVSMLKEKERDSIAQRERACVSLVYGSERERAFISLVYG